MRASMLSKNSYINLFHSRVGWLKVICFFTNHVHIFIGSPWPIKLVSLSACDNLISALHDMTLPFTYYSATFHTQTSSNVCLSCLFCLHSGHFLDVNFAPCMITVIRSFWLLGSHWDAFQHWFSVGICQNMSEKIIIIMSEKCLKMPKISWNIRPYLAQKISEVFMMCLSECAPRTKLFLKPLKVLW